MSISVVVFTLNEERNLDACLKSVAWSDDIVVVDSFSTDGTARIAVENGARFVQHEFTGFGTQRNWALSHSGLRNDWVLILDADEKVPQALAREMMEKVARAEDNVAAFRVKRRFYLWGRWLRFSSLYPTWVVRLVHRNRVQYIDRGHAETQQVSGSIASLTNDLIDENCKSLEDWIERQNRYSSRDAIYELEMMHSAPSLTSILSKDPLNRRAAFKQLISRLPFRPVIYFIYVFLFRGGFLDGRDGFVFCRMRAMYQSMVVIKKYDLNRRRD